MVSSLDIIPIIYAVFPVIEASYCGMFHKNHTLIHCNIQYHLVMDIILKPMTLIVLVVMIFFHVGMIDK